MGSTTVRDDHDVDRLVSTLLAPDRATPLVILSTPPEATAPLIDATALAADLADLAAVTIVPTGHLTWRLASLLPDRCAVWGGAGRVYPVGDAWQRDPLRSPLRFVYSARDAARAQDQLFDDAVAMSAAAGHTSFVTSPRWSVVDAVVKGVVAGTRAIVQSPSGALATISADLTFPGIPFDWYVRPGQRVRGRLDPRNNLLHVEVPEVTAGTLLERFPFGTVTLALVDEVGDDSATLLLHPRVGVIARREDVSSNPLDAVSQLLQRGEVLPARVVAGPDGGLLLRLDDIDDEEPVLPAVALLDGGPPWLVEGRDLVAPEPDLVPEPLPIPEPPPPASEAPAVAAPPATPPASRPLPRPGPRRSVPLPPAEAQPDPPRSTALQQVQLQLDAARAEIRRLQSGAAESPLRLQLAQEQAQAARLRTDLTASRREAADLKKRARASGTAHRSPSASRDRFDTADDWVRHEVLLTWVERIGPAERREHPLGDGWTLGPRFAASLEERTESQLRKVFRTVLDVVLGLDAALDGRELHRLRTGSGGGDPTVDRASDGATAWRVAVERNAPAALRLHYWRTHTGIELGRVAQHDDFTI